MSDNWINRLAFIDGVMPAQEEVTEPIAVKRKRKQKDKRARVNKSNTIEEEIIAELVEQNPVFMATRYYQQARRRMENSTPDYETVNTVVELLLSAAKYFRMANRPKDILGCNLYLTNWYWAHGDERQKQRAVAYALRSIKRTRSGYPKADEQIIAQFNEETKRKIS